MHIIEMVWGYSNPMQIVLILGAQTMLMDYEDCGWRLGNIFHISLYP